MRSARTGAFRVGALAAGISWLFFVAAAPVAAETGALEKKLLDVALDGQETDVWCWASSGQMIMGHFGKTVSQCEQATERYGEEEGIDCCDLKKLQNDKTVHDTCVKGGWPEFDDWGFDSENTKHDCDVKDRCPLSWEELRAQIDSDRPVAFSWRFEGGGGHMMTAVGYVFIPPDGRYVVIHDPWPPDNGDVEMITYDYYRTGSYEHWRDYYDITPVAAGKTSDKSGAADTATDEADPKSASDAAQESGR